MLTSRKATRNALTCSFVSKQTAVWDQCRAYKRRYWATWLIRIPNDLYESRKAFSNHINESCLFICAYITILIFAYVSNEFEFERLNVWMFHSEEEEEETRRRIWNIAHSFISKWRLMVNVWIRHLLFHSIEETVQRIWSILEWITLRKSFVELNLLHEKWIWSTLKIRNKWSFEMKN